MIRYLVLTVTLVIMVLPTSKAFSSSLPNGAECASLPSTTTGTEVDKVRGQCESGYCLPGPSKHDQRSSTTTWYCTDADKDCAWPDRDGYKFSIPKWRAGQIYTCQDPGDGGWAQFLPMR